MMLAATRGGTGDALFAELQASQPQILAWLKRSLAQMPPKAYRWIAEMHEIADFVGEDPAAHELYLGATHFYEQIARDFESDKRQWRRSNSGRTWLTETRLRGWACEIRTQKRREKLSL
jgi:Domain of unknown function (DUF1932)